MACNTYQNNLESLELEGSSSPFLKERTKKLLIFLNVGSIIQSKLLFFGSVFISDLYLSHDLYLSQVF